ncbi:RluA family pseudouridine synthase [Thermaurantiacus tibetensis]|uniref:RluA family pseudouridine synthase n=1 Tax=Thermaurantiacus tibetensis TaxID=2759035 RepID=UPI00188FD6FB|nr:RluA family pseudouridine synthase [Thermaurantiacus tibetensis]
MPRARLSLPAILHEDRECLVVDKPAGLAVHPGPRTCDSLETRLAGAGLVWKPVHRLDTDTSGCLLLAKRPASLRRLMGAFAARQVEKVYLALVAPAPEAASGVVKAPLVKRSRPGTGWRMDVAEGGLPAVTRWEVLARRDGVALVRFRPETGRTHQLRVHATRLGAGCAIVGDARYGRGEPGGLMLHAHALGFAGADGQWREVVAPLPERFRARGFALS